MTPTTNPNPSATDREHPPYDVEIMSPGSFDFGPGQHFTFDEAAFDEMIRNFDTLQGKHDVPVRVQLGHDDHQVLDGQQSGDPSFGWAERLWKKGSGASARLMATIVGMPHALREAINRRGYRKVSLAAYSN